MIIPRYAAKSTYLHYMKSWTKSIYMPIAIYVATDLSMLNDCPIVSKHLELHSISFISPDMSLFSIFSERYHNTFLDITERGYICKVIRAGENVLKYYYYIVLQ